jgi:sterol desaturase/sphingolipid hydroxylase (fatty acid hydroxylase superfamily)
MFLPFIFSPIMLQHVPMEGMDVAIDFWLTTSYRVAFLAVFFSVLVRLTPCNPGMYCFKDLRGLVTDFMYWFAVPLFLSNCRTILLIAAADVLYPQREPDLLPVRDWPLWQQCLLMLVLQDIMLYGIHRLFHTRFGWRFHAVHHSPQVLDWFSAARFHPINHLLAFTLTDMAVLLMGFAPFALLVMTPFNVFYSALVHANLNWTFGPLRYVFASPVFHRWHHTTQAEGRDKNFASTFPVLDLLFGTYYMPAEKLPAEFGSGEEDFPADLLGQFLYPLRNRPDATPAEEIAERKAA